MQPSPDLKPVFKFLAGLRDNNNKAWFEENRASYDVARAHFESFVELLIAELSSVQDMRGVTAKESIFRINRDLRFSKDKSPYKTNLGADIVPGGRKSGKLGYYLHLQPGNHSFLGGGMHMPAPADLARFRGAVDRDAGAFQKIIEAPEFRRYFGSLEGERLATAPKGYSRDHPALTLLRLKEVTAGQMVADKQVLARDFASYAVQVFRAMKPFLDYLNAL